MIAVCGLGNSESQYSGVTCTQTSAHGQRTHTQMHTLLGIQRCARGHTRARAHKKKTRAWLLRSCTLRAENKARFLRDSFQRLRGLRMLVDRKWTGLCPAGAWSSWRKCGGSAARLRALLPSAGEVGSHTPPVRRRLRRYTPNVNVHHCTTTSTENFPNQVFPSDSILTTKSCCVDFIISQKELTKENKNFQEREKVGQPA